MPIIVQQTQLKRLTIYGCGQVTDEGIGILKALKNLRELYVRDKRMSKQGVEELKKALPDCDVSND